MKKWVFSRVSSLLFGLLPSIVFASEKSSVGSIALDLMGPANMITKLVHLVCIIVGFILLFVAFSQFKANRFNAKFIPLERPIIITVLAVILIGIPFYGKIFHPTGGIHDEAAIRGIYTNDPDAPLTDEWGDDYDH